MKYLLTIFILNISICSFCADTAMEFYVFEKSDFDKHILKDKKPVDLKENEIISNH